MGRTTAFVAACLVNPIAWPGWAFEWVVRRFKPDWEFSSYTATPYFLILTITATWMLLVGVLWQRWIGMYIITAMEIVAIWSSIVIAIGRKGQIYSYLIQYTRRKSPEHSVSRFDTKRIFYIVIVAYFFTVYYFCCLYYFVDALCATCFVKKGTEGVLSQFFDFLYFSFITITTYGYDGISPNSVLVKALIMLQITIGLFLSVFVFGSFVSLQAAQSKE